MKNQNSALKTWLWIVLLVAALPIINYYGVPYFFGIAVLLVLGFTFWRSGNQTREKLFKSAPLTERENSFQAPQPGLRTHPTSLQDQKITRNRKTS